METVFITKEGKAIDPMKGHVINGTQWGKGALLKDAVRKIAGVTTKQVTVPGFDANTQEKPTQKEDGEYNLPEELPLEVAQENKVDEIRLAFEISSLDDVVDSQGRHWVGGWDSAMKLDAARRLSSEAGLTHCRLYDTSNVGHILTQLEAKQVVLLVGDAFQTKLGLKQNKYKQIRDAKTNEELRDIKW